MINLKRFKFNMLEENCYILSDDTKEAVIIDCGALYDAERIAIVSYIKKNQLKPVRLNSTHGHFDHNFGNDTIYSAFGLQPEVTAEDADLMDLKTQVEKLIGVPYTHDVPPLGRALAIDEPICFGTHQLTIIPTPGHTHGSVCFYCEAEKTLFTGDTLFQMSIGRTDFEEGCWADMQQSLRVLAKLPADTNVYSGHGEPTTIGNEIRYNPYMR